jgi:SAM-dependent methyltransferase
MRLNDFYSLFTREGQWALESAMAFMPREKDFLSDFQMLAKRFPREVARAALTTAILRGEAESKFPQAEKMFFTRQALEQATPYPVAAQRARRFRDSGEFSRILDLGCSVGGDSIALAKAARVVGLDRDAVRVAMAAKNAESLRVDAQFMQADLNDLPFDLARLGGDTALFFDPARRTDHKRAFSVEDYQPPLSIIQGWLESVPALGVKVSPGVNLDELAAYDCEVEFISLNGDLKEAALWFGPLKSAERRATLLVSDEVDTQNVYTLTAETQPDLPLSEPRAFLYEPDAAILRAGLVQALGGMLDAAMLDPEIAYLTADEYIPTPYARAWPVQEWMPFHLKKLRAMLRERNIGAVTVKKRGSPLVPEELATQLKLEGEEHQTLFLTQVGGSHSVVLVGEEISR